MRNKTLRWKTIVLCSIMFCLPKTPLAGQESSGFIHRLGMEARPQYVFPTNPFLQGENERWKPIQTSFAAHLKYSFKFRPNTCADRIYGGAYQGIGVSLTTFGDKKQLGDPFSFYVFQGARIARFSPRASLNYEWNFGLSAGWKPYDNYYNSYNGAVGSRMNAYINAGVYINWAFSRPSPFSASIFKHTKFLLYTSPTCGNGKTVRAMLRQGPHHSVKKSMKIFFFSFLAKATASSQLP